MRNVSAFGFEVTLIASVTFPAGIQLSAWADDVDPFDVPSVQIADKNNNVNGEMVHWSKSNPIPLTLNFIPGSPDERNMEILYEANRVAKGKTSARDVIQLTVSYPDGRLISYINGIITDGLPGNAISNQGRQKSKNYNLAFENKT
ncbi:tail fiber protein [Burkholderia phage Bm1]